MLLDCSKLSEREVYKLLISCIGPRPIGWISTYSHSGVANLAPYSFFNMLSMNPAILAFSAALKEDGAKKDSLRNAEASGAFIHNVVTQDLVEPMNQSSAEYASDLSEFDQIGLTAVPGNFVRAPRVKEAKISCECELIQVVSLGEKAGNGQLVLGRVVGIHVNDESLLTERGDFEASRLPLISRLGRLNYMGPGEIFSKPRP
jgi:flavin reductase (DIM6/NTAB) family NADH-FMN oxidoreductase RutF